MANLQIKEELQPGKFTIKNYDELESIISNVTAKYSKLVVTRESLPEIKKDKAELNNFSKAINQKRIMLKKEYMKNFEEGANQCDKLVQMIQEASDNLNNQIKELEDQDKQLKREQILTIFQEVCEEQKFNLLSFEAFEDKSFYNYGTSLTKVRKELTEKIVQVINDLYVIDTSFGERVGLAKEVKVEYFTLRENKVENALSLAMQKITERVNQRIKLERAKIDASVEPSNVKKFDVRYIITGTREELKQVSEYLKDSGLKFKVEMKD